MASIAGLNISMSVDNNPLRRGLNESRRMTSSFVSRTQSALGGLGRVLGGGAVIAGVNSVIDATTNFDTALREVQAVTGATGDAFDAIGNQARELGSTTQFTATQAAQAQAFLGRAGFDTNEILAATPGLLDLAAAGQLDLARAADIASNAVQGFGLRADETGRVSDILAAGAANSNTNVEQLGDAFSFLAPVASNLGISIEESAAAIGVLSDAGIQGGRAGRNLSTALTNLLRPSMMAAGILENIGIATRDANGDFRNIADLVDDFAGALDDGRLDEETFSRIFSAEGFRAFATLTARGADDLRSFTDDLEESAGSAEEQAEIINSGPAGAFRELNSAIESVQIAIGESGFIELLSTLATNFADIVRSVSDFVRQEPLISSVIGVISAGIAGLIIVGGPITLFTAAIAGIIAFWPEIMEGASAAAAGIRTAWEGLSGFLTAPFVALRDTAINILRGMVERISNIIDNAPDWLVPEGLREGVDGFLSELDRAAEEAVFGSIIPDMVEEIEMWMNMLPTIAQQAGMGFRDGFTSFAMEALDVSSQIASTTSNAFNGLADGIADLVTGGMFSFREFARSIVRDLIAIQLRASLAQASLQLFGGSGGGGGFLSSLFGGGLQEGGVARRNTPYLVGEAGPELFVPGRTGTVVPNDELGSGGTSQTVNINISGNVDQRAINQIQQVVQNSPRQVGGASQTYQNNTRGLNARR